jgi:flagellar hook-length control protein FliK
MAVMTVNNSGIDVSKVMNVTAASSSKTKVDTSQDFGSVFNNAAQNSKSQQDNIKTTKTDTEVSKLSQKEEPVDDNTPLDTVSSKPVEEEEASVLTEEEPSDEVIEDVATALNNILIQIMETLNVDEDTIAVAMDDLGLGMGDLLNSDNMASLLTALLGEESTISLVTDEDLYSKLQSLTEIVDMQFETVLEDTGLSTDELNAILENFEPVNNQEELVGDEIPKDMVAYDDENLEIELAPQDEEVLEEPIVIVQDNTTKPASTYKNLPENQQDTSNLKSQTQTPDTTKTVKNEDNQSKDYSQNQSLNQNQETLLNENVAEIKDTVESYTTLDTESVMRQLADAVKLVKDDNLTQMELQLHPANLGTVNVSIITKGGAVTAQFTTQSEQVKAAIEAQATQLQTNLENQGVKVEAIEVTVESHQMERNLDEDNRRREREGEQAEESIKAIRRANINLRTLGEDGDLLEEIQGADDATRIAMELMSARGNTMDMLA